MMRLLVSPFLVFHHPFATHLDRTAAFFVNNPQIFTVGDDSPAERKIRAFDQLQQILRLGIRVVDQVNTRRDQFSGYGGMLVAIPTAMPDAPLASRLGYRAGRTTGSSSRAS